MQQRHSDQEQYFAEQAEATRRYIVPFIERLAPVGEDMAVAEIGCGAGGGMLPFLERGCRVWGIDINTSRIELAGGFHSGAVRSGRLTLMSCDIYDVDPSSLPQFDLIIMRDVLEHIHDQERFLGHLHRFLKPGGMVFIAFPPFMMPFGGHQQVCRNRIACRLPYFHLLPGKLYRAVLRALGEVEGKIDDLLEIKETRLHLWRFHRIVKRSRFTIAKEELYLINPNYEVKFGLRPRRLPMLMNIPFAREFYTTSCYAILVAGS